MLKMKMIRDIKQHFGQFLSIFLLSFLAICLYTGLAAEISSVNYAREVYHKNTNLAEHWIYGDKFSKEQVAGIADISGVTEAHRRMYIETAGDKKTSMFLYLQEDDRISKPYVLEGDAYDTDDNESIWLCKRFANEQNLSVGDNYALTINDKEYTFKIAGLVWSPEYEYYKKDIDFEPDYTNTGYGFVSIKVLPEEEQKFNQITLTSTIDDIGSIENDISGVLDGGYSVLLNREGIINLTTVDDEIEQHKMMSLLFPAFFIAIALLTTITTMKRIVDRQRTQIGTLKAIGVGKKKIYMHYLGYGFFPSLAGVLLGTIIGPQTLSPLLFKMNYYMDSSDNYMLPHFNIKYSASFWLLGAAIVILCTISTWLSCRRILQIAPATALRPAQPKSAKKTIWEGMPLWSKLSFKNRYNLRDISRHKARTVFGLAGTLSCMALLLCGFAAKDNFQSAVAKLYAEKLMNNSAIVSIKKETPIEEAERIRNEADGELVMSDTTEIRLPGKTDKYTYHINVYEDSHIANALDENLNTIKLVADDFTITKKTADKLGVSVGDKIEWHIYGSSQWKTSAITKITRAPFEQGIVTTRKVVEDLGYKFTPTRFITQKDITESFANVSEYIDNVTTKSKLSDLLYNYMELINMMMVFMIVFALFLAGIVLYSLGLLSFEERQKEMATLKVLGFGSGELRRLMLQQNIFLAVFGSILGIPLGSVMLKTLVSSLGDSMDIPTSSGILYILLAFTITVVTSIVVNMFFTKRIRNMDMVAETKSAE